MCIASVPLMLLPTVSLGCSLCLVATFKQSWVHLGTSGSRFLEQIFLIYCLSIGYEKKMNTICAAKILLRFQVFDFYNNCHKFKSALLRIFVIILLIFWLIFFADNGRLIQRK